MNNLITMLALI